jgi:hypothetical protein
MAHVCFLLYLCLICVFVYDFKPCGKPWLNQGVPEADKFEEAWNFLLSLMLRKIVYENGGWILQNPI